MSTAPPQPALALRFAASLLILGLCLPLPATAGIKGGTAQGGPPPDGEPTKPPNCDTSPCPIPTPNKAPETSNSTGQSCPDPSANAGDPVCAYTGRMFLEKTDLVVNGVVPIRMVRQYDSQSRYDSPLGYGWSFTYDTRLFEYPSGQVVIRGWEGRLWRYDPPPQGSNAFSGSDPDQGMVPELERVTGSSAYEYALTYDDGNRALFDAEGRLYAFETPQGNRLRFFYSPTKQPLSGMSPYAVDPTVEITVAHVWRITEIKEQLLSQVDDVPEDFTDRQVTFAYHATGRVHTITSHDGRVVEYHYQEQLNPPPALPVFRGNLARVVGPYGPGETAADAVTEIYGYPPDPTSQAPTVREYEHIHNLTSYDDGPGTQLHLTGYDPATDRVTSQTYGNAQWTFAYNANPPTQTTVTRTINTPNLPATQATTIFKFNGDGFLTEKIDAEGDKLLYARPSGFEIDFVKVLEGGTTETRHVDFGYHGDGRRHTRAVTLAGSSETVTQTFEYNGRFLASYTTQSSDPELEQAELFRTELEYFEDAASRPVNLQRIKRRNGTSGGSPVFVTTEFTYHPDHNQLATIVPPAVSPADGLKVERIYYTAGDNQPGVILEGLLKTIRLAVDVGGTPTPIGHLRRDFTYDAAGNVASVTDARGHRTDFAWDSRSRLIRRTERIGGTGNELDWESTLLRYGAPNEGGAPENDFDTPGLHLLQVESGALGATGTTTAGQVRRFVVDPRGRIVKVQRKSSATSFPDLASFAYDSDDNRAHVSETAEAGTRTLRLTYDKMKRLTSVKDDANNLTVFTYDALGNRTQVTDARGKLTRFEHDELDRLVGVEQQGVSPALVTAFAYDAAGNVTRVTDPKNQATEYRYDELSRLRRVTQALGLATPDPDDYAVRYDDYDDRGRLTHVTNARDQVLAYAYHPWGGLEQVEHDVDGGGTDRTISYAFDLNGNVLTTTDDEIQASPLYTFSYDALNRIEEVMAHYGPGTTLATLASTYDPFGNRDSLALDPVGENLRHQWTVDTLDRLVAACMPQDQETPTVPCVSAGATETLAFGYAANDDLATLTHGNGLVTDYDRHPEGPIESITVGAAPLHGLVYTVDDVLNVDTITETIGGSAQSPAYDFDYDDVYRLTSASYPTGAAFPPGPESFGYDDAGNRDDDPGAPTPWAYDANNRLVASPVSVLSCHDDDGNLTSRRSAGTCTSGTVTETFGWDATNRLTAYTNATTTASYAYDPFGRRIRKTVEGDDTWYVWDGDQLLAEYGSTGTRTLRYAHAGGFAPVQVAFDDNEGGEDVYDVHTDHLDTPRMLTDASGAAVWRATYAAFGKAVVEDIGEDPIKGDFNIRFPGQYYDAETENAGPGSGMHYNRHRVYDPAVGRYVSADPIGQAGGTNAYLYVLGMPTGAVDPRGLDLLVIEGGATISNPGGHTAGSVSTQGLYSYGTVDPIGGSTTAYVANQATYRDSEVTLIKTTPAQDAAFIDAFNAARANGYSLLTNNCSTAVNAGLTAAGIPGSLGPLNSIPGVAGMRAKAASSQQNGGGNPTTIRIPKGGSATPAISRFNAQ